MKLESDCVRCRPLQVLMTQQLSVSELARPRGVLGDDEDALALSGQLLLLTGHWRTGHHFHNIFCNLLRNIEIGAGQ